jgi:hypothetical protein
MQATPRYLYLRGLRQVDHTVFCVADGQKTYRDPLTNTYMPYSSGQQVKRSILDSMIEALGMEKAPVTFNFTLEKDKSSGKQTFGQGEPWSVCDPSYPDQLIGGWMRAGKASAPMKRRSPLSISALRPLHPTLAGLAREPITFDRSDEPERQKVRVIDEDGKEVSHEAFIAFLRSENRNLPMRHWIPQENVGPRASGLFIYDIAIDLRTLFSVSLNDFEPELAPETAASLMENGWQKSANGDRLICPREMRERIIAALAHSLLFWRVTSNQSRTFSPQNTLAVAISNHAGRIADTIRAELTEESEYKRAVPILEKRAGAELYVTLPAKAYVADVTASADALDAAEQHLRQRLLGVDYAG